jgi:uncharacterized delta-60 repeat protein
MKRNIIYTIILSCLFQTIIAQPGQLDPAFGNHGIVKANLGGPVLDITYFSGDQAIPLPGGQMYWVLEASGRTYISKRFSNGAADTTYGDKGFAPVDLTGSHAVLQIDGKLLIGGTAPDGHISIYRCNTNGSLDSSFSGDGKLTSDASLLGIQKDGKIAAVGKGYLFNFNSNGSTHSSYLIAPVPFTGFYSDAASWLRTGTFLQSDGKIILAGIVGFLHNMALVRINQNGSIDTTFGDKGLVVNVFDSCTSYANTVAIQPDGKIVVGGHAYVGEMSVNAFFILARFNVNGSLDTMFGVGGRQKTVFEGHYSVGTHVVIAPDGKIVLEGRADNLMAIVRYNKNGFPDSSFNGDGKQLNPQSPDDIHSDIAVQSDLKIVGVGSGTGIAVVRYNENGTLDDSFGQGGVATDNFTKNLGTSTTLVSIRSQSDGKLLAVGTGGNGSAVFPVRFNKNGTFDSTYNQVAGSMVGYDLGALDPWRSYHATTVAVQNDNKFVVAGHNPQLNTQVLDRFTTDGVPDSSFSGDGICPVSFFSTPTYSGNPTLDDGSFAIQPDGKFVAGSSRFSVIQTQGWTYLQTDFAFARYNNSGDVDSSFGVNGLQTFRFSPLEARLDGHITAVAVQDDGKIVAAGYMPGTGTLYFIRCNPDGSIDWDFNYIWGSESPGYNLNSSNPLPGFPPAKFILIQKDGKIVALLDGPGIFEILRFNTDGSFDPTFNGSGIVTGNFDSTATANALVIQADGKLIVGGYVKADNLNNGDFALARYNTDGTPDSTFGKYGRQITDAGGSESINSMAIANNRLYVVGNGVYGSNNVGVMASYFLDYEQPTVACPALKIVSTAKNRCDTVVNNIDPVVSVAGTQINYRLSGATTGTGSGSASGKVFNKGTTTVKYSVAADTANYCSFTVTVNDHQAPDLSPVFAFPYVLWPANNTMRNVYLVYLDRDNCGNTNCKISVTSNQDISGDWQIVNDHQVKLRAQYSGNKTRVYTITVTCTDASGNTSRKNVNVKVPDFRDRDLYVYGNDPDTYGKFIDGFVVRAYPNPGNDHFNLQVITNNNHDKISLRIFDMSGRMIDAQTGINAGATIVTGSSLKTGIYTAEVRQGMNVQRLKLVKIK